MQINDGTGRGYVAEVTSDNRLAVESSGLSEAASAARKGVCYVSTTGVTADTLTVTATGGTMIIIKNNSTTESIIIDQVTLSTDNVKARYKEIVDMAIGTIADATTGKAISTQTSSGKKAPVTVYAWDETNNGVGGLSAGTDLIVAYATTGVTVFDHDGSTVISHGSNFAVGLKNISGGAMEAAVSVRYYVTTL